MKIKIFISLICIILSLGYAFAINPKPDYAKFYNISNDLNIKFNQLDKDRQKTLSKEDKKLYKKLLKNEKYIAKGKIEKADKYYPNLIPNYIRLMDFYNAKSEYQKALDYANKIKEEDKWNLVQRPVIDYRIAVLYSGCGDYLNSNKILAAYIKTKNPVYDASLFQLGQNYFYMQDYKNAVLYESKISNDSRFFVPAQEILFTAYTVMKNPAGAYKSAANLIKYCPNEPNNYMRLAYTTSNPDEKLINYYKAKNLYFAQNSLSMVKKINELIVPIEQKRIDKAYDKITNYCKKPDWIKIRKRNQDLLKDDIIYWDRRQDDFFETANDCIKRYSGNNLIACFSELNNSQTLLDKDLNEENARRMEAKQREEQNILLQQQNALLKEQNRLRYYQWYSPRYYDYYFGRYPYYW